MSDLLFQNISTVQSEQQPKPNTIASAATIAPVHFMTFVTGTVAVATITPPVSGCHMLCLVFTDAAPGTMLTTGNVQAAIVPTQNLPTIMVYDPNTAKYWGAATNLT
jgi:hypothetical protein